MRVYTYFPPACRQFWAEFGSTLPAPATAEEIAKGAKVEIDVASSVELAAIRDRLGGTLSTVLRGRALKLLPQGSLEGVSVKDLGSSLGMLSAPCWLVLGDVTEVAADAAPADADADADAVPGDDAAADVASDGGGEKDGGTGETEGEAAGELKREQAAAAARLAALAAKRQLDQPAAAVAEAPPATPPPTPQILDDDEDEDEEASGFAPALAALLETHRLQRLEPGLRALGVEEPIDLEDVSDAELEGMGAKPVMIRRFRKAVADVVVQLTKGEGGPSREEL